jgi:hypothetical protein
MFAWIACQRAYRELALGLSSAYNRAALVPGRTDHRDDFFRVRHLQPSMSGFSVATTLGSRLPSLQPLLFDTIHRQWRYIKSGTCGLR